MTVDPFIERAEPGSGSARDDSHPDPILQADANAALEHWLQDHPEASGKLMETFRAHIHLQELEARTREAGQAHRAADHPHSTLLTRYDPAGHRVLGFLAGGALVVALVGDAIPLNWAAQASGLDSGGTWLVTCIQAAADSRATQATAARRLQRHIGALWQMLLPWALGTAAPDGIDRAKWAVALKQSVRQLFPTS
jgi:hypothetical protein